MAAAGCYVSPSRACPLPPRALLGLPLRLLHPSTLPLLRQRRTAQACRSISHALPLLPALPLVLVVLLASARVLAQASVVLGLALGLLMGQEGWGLVPPLAGGEGALLGHQASAAAAA